MTQEPQKSNVLITIAIIGVMGTVIAAVVTVLGNYNVEKLRQKTELTRIALVSIQTQGNSNTPQAPIENTTSLLDQPTTQAIEIPQAQPPASTQTPEPIQYTPQYSDFLGKNQYDPNFLNMSQIYCGFGQYDWVCPVLGIEFSDSQGDNIVDEVWIYPSGYANFEAYKGSLPYGLAWGDTYADVANKIGQPDAFLNYGWVYTNLGIKIHYQTDAPSIPDPSETIQYILIFLP